MGNKILRETMRLTVFFGYPPVFLSFACYKMGRRRLRATPPPLAAWPQARARWLDAPTPSPCAMPGPKLARAGWMPPHPRRVL